MFCFVEPKIFWVFVLSDVKEWRLKCRVCGGVVKGQGTKQQLDEWMQQDFGECPAGGRHVELGKRKDYLELTDVSDELSKIEKWKPDSEKQYVDIHKIKGLTHVGFGVFKDAEGNTYDYEKDEYGRRHYFKR